MFTILEGPLPESYGELQWRAVDRFMVEFPECNTTIRAFLDLENQSVIVTDGTERRVYHFDALL
jgi:hypothetical protein